jgi:hypothetical protein
MFGKPQWFRPKAFGWGLIPIAWQGWAYTAAWVGAIGVPFVLLVGRHQAMEAMAWLGLSVGALVYDVRQVLCGFRASATPSPGASGSAAKLDDNVLYIADSRPGQGVATRNYNLQLRR